MVYSGDTVNRSKFVINLRINKSLNSKEMKKAEAARGIARAGVVGVSTDPGVWGVDPPTKGEAGQFLDSRMPLEASNYINFTKK